MNLPAFAAGLLRAGAHAIGAGSLAEHEHGEPRAVGQRPEAPQLQAWLVLAEHTSSAPLARFMAELQNERSLRETERDA